MVKRPLSNSFFLTAILLFFASVFLGLGDVIPAPWAFTITLMSIIFIIASILSSTPEAHELPIIEQDWDGHK